MKQAIYRFLLAHPHSVEETYFQHFRFATKFAFSLFVAGIAALIHAICPALCERTASRIVNELHFRMHKR